MADEKLSALTEVTSSADADLLYTVQNGNSRKTTRAKVIAPTVRHDIDQILTNLQKLKARQNISAAQLGEDGKVPLDQLPDELFGDIITVATEAEMLALNVPRGSIAIRTDVQKNFVLKEEPASQLANWAELATPTAPVTSVNGNTGAVIVDYPSLGEIPSQQLPGRIRTNTTVVEDANLAVESGWYVIGGTGANLPVALAGFIFTVAQAATMLTQVWYQRSGYRSFIRFCNNGTWGAWTEVATDTGATGLALTKAATEAAARTAIGSNRPIFAAYPPNDISISNGINYPSLSATLANNGNHWNGTRFLCPEAGFYRFAFSTQWNGGGDNTGYAISRIKKNNVTALSGIINKLLYFSHSTTEGIIPCAVGDTVTIEYELVNASGIVVLQASNTRFSGFLIR